MVFRMKTTLIIPDNVFKQLKRAAVDREETVSALVVEFLRMGLAKRDAVKALRPLPAFKVGKVKVDVANREELYRIMEQA